MGGEGADKSLMELNFRHCDSLDDGWWWLSYWQVSWQGAPQHPGLHASQVSHLHLLQSLQEVEDTESRFKIVEFCVAETRNIWHLHSIHWLPGAAHQKPVTTNCCWITSSHHLFRFGINLRYLELPCDLITVDVLNELAQRCPNLTHLLLDFSHGAQLADFSGGF